MGEWLYLTVCPLRGPGHDSSVGEWMWEPLSLSENLAHSVRTSLTQWEPRSLSENIITSVSVHNMGANIWMCLVYWLMASVAAYKLRPTYLTELERGIWKKFCPNIWQFICICTPMTSIWCHFQFSLLETQLRKLFNITVNSQISLQRTPNSANSITVREAQLRDLSNIRKYIKSPFSWTIAELVWYCSHAASIPTIIALYIDSLRIWIVCLNSRHVSPT